MRWGLRAKILVSTGLIILGVLGTSTLVHIRYSERDYLESVEWRAESLAQSIAAEVVKWAGGGQSRNIQTALKGSAFQCRQLYELNKDKQVTHVAILDDTGNIVVHNNRDLEDTPVTNASILAHLGRRKLTTISDGASYHTLIPIFAAEQMYLGTIDIGHDQRLVDLKIQQILRRSLLLFAVFLILAFFPVSIFVHAFVINPVAKLTRSSSAIASGDLEQRIDVKGNDELSLLAHSFVSMRDAIRKKIHELQDLNADLDRRVQARTTELERLQQLMRQIINVAELLGTASKDLTHISSQMAVGAEQTSQQVQVVSSNSKEIHQSVHDVSVATEEVSANIHEISRNIQEVSQIINNAVEISHSANTTLTDLAASSQEIRHIIKIITNITQQTNVLALNATIEAARAGDFGRGFSVVAHQVKELARETTVSAEDITHKIAAIQMNSQEAMHAMHAVADITNRVALLSTTITSAISEQSHVMQEVSVRIADTAEGSNEIAQTIEGITTLAQGFSERATHVQKGAQLLAELSNQLRQLVEDFQQ